MSRAAHPAGPRHADILPGSGVSAPPADLNALEAKVWPSSARREESGEISLVSDVIADALASGAAIDPMQVGAWAMDNPLHTGPSAAGRARNRRVEIHVR